MNELDAARTIKTNLSSAKVILMTFHDEPAYRDAAIAAKADGFLSKQFLGASMLPMVKQLFSTEIASVANHNNSYLI